ncbi:MAG: NAD synthetase [Verrucomicrobiales bacterium]|nr:NAD synthetase [Verrucomicrobiales bacterium]|tara:strand:+ start:2797 stop:4170 length:1374 start_codon:yes stop_codon:yes gene_type:complete
MQDNLINVAYIIAAILFIMGIKMLGSASTAVRGNRISSFGMLLAVIVTLLRSGLDYKFIILGLIVGGIIGLIAAKKVQMTGMPELVALFNGFGGLASLLVGWSEFEKSLEFNWFLYLVVSIAILIGGVTFSGSIIAYLKLSGKIGGNAVIFPFQKFINLLIMAGAIIIGLLLVLDANIIDNSILVWVLIGLAVLVGILGVIPIGGGDMPVVIALLNSFSGLGAAAAGFVITNTVLVVAGCLVGASGLILSIIMCKAMNRSLANVLFGGFGSTNNSTTAEVDGEMKALSVEDSYYVLEAAQSVVFVPGYGMAVAQAQHVVKELAEILEKNGAEVRHAVHPVAGRMPGHMNVLLAEADVPYEQLCEMEEVNSVMPTIDVAIIIGANDVVNPAAIEDENSPIYGMPIINAHQAKSVFVLKRGQGAGYSGIINTLFFRENCRMIYGDAKATISSIVSQFDD